MSPRTHEQFQEIREQRIFQIMEACMELMYEKGYDGTSISAIAKKAGISKGLMYNYFESKEDLTKQIMLHGLSEMMQGLDANHDGILTVDELEDYIKSIIKSLKNNSKFWKLYINLFMKPEIIVLVQNEVETIQKEMTGLLAKYFDENNYEHPEEEAIIFGAAMDGLGLQYAMAPDQFPLEYIEQVLLKRYCKTAKKKNKKK